MYELPPFHASPAAFLPRPQVFKCERRRYSRNASRTNGSVPKSSNLQHNARSYDWETMSLAASTSDHFRMCFYRPPTTSISHYSTSPSADGLEHFPIGTSAQSKRIRGINFSRLLKFAVLVSKCNQHAMLPCPERRYKHTSFTLAKNWE